MSDLISRAEALDALDEQIRQCDKALGTFDISMKDEYAVKVERASLVAFRETLEYMPPAQQWIPISEGLPEMTDTYLVQVGVNENGEGMHTEARTADWNAVWQTWYVHTTRCLVGDIIKWMPIPWEGSDRHEG